MVSIAPPPSCPAIVQKFELYEAAVNTVGTQQAIHASAVDFFNATSECTERLHAANDTEGALRSLAIEGMAAIMVADAGGDPRLYTLAHTIGVTVDQSTEDPDTRALARLVIQKSLGGVAG